jgi:DNA-binding response OmpR family regulator
MNSTSITPGTSSVTSIVYLDDSDLALDAVKDGLEPLGFAVTTHRNPVTIYAALTTVAPDLLLVDANMPTLDGKTICALVRRHLKSLPVAIFSADHPEDLEALVAACGADGYIVKSGDYPAIAANIRAIISGKRGTAPR